MARPRYRPKLPDTLQAQQHDGYAGKLAQVPEEGDVPEILGLPSQLYPQAPHEARPRFPPMVVVAFIVAAVLGGGLLWDSLVG